MGTGNKSGNNRSRQDVDVGEHWLTHIYAPDKELQAHASVVVTVPQVGNSATREGKTRKIALTEGGDVTSGVELSPDRPFVSQQSDEGDLSRTVIYDTGVAVGYYLHHLETHGQPEDRVWDQIGMLADETDFPLDQHLEFKDTLNVRHRRMRLIDLLEFRIDDGDWALKPYLHGDSVGSWRSTSLSEAGEGFAKSVAQSIELNPKHCYRTAQQAAIKHKDNSHVDYVEGIALQKQGAQAERHAWVEYDNEVVELTWPWHSYDGDEAVYYGHRFGTDEVEHTFERRNGGSPLALSDDEITRMSQVRSGGVEQ